MDYETIRLSDLGPENDTNLPNNVKKLREQEAGLQDY